MKTVMITGVTGTLGEALAREYAGRDWEVVGVSRNPDAKVDGSTRCVENRQETFEDACALLENDVDVAVLNAGQIETEIGTGGLPLAGQVEAIYRVNTVFPSLFAIAAAESKRERPLDVVAIGSIADGSPSSFGPVYHASKIALHYFFSGVGPIATGANARVRLRVYRPGAIRGPLSWAPAIRLNERGVAIRRRRCEAAPEASRVARDIADWIDGDAVVGTWDEPLSFRALKWLFATAPDLYARIQRVGWRKGSRFGSG